MYKALLSYDGENIAKEVTVDVNVEYVRVAQRSDILDIPDWGNIGKSEAMRIEIHELIFRYNRDATYKYHREFLCNPCNNPHQKQDKMYRKRVFTFHNAGKVSQPLFETFDIGFLEPDKNVNLDKLKIKCKKVKLPTQKILKWYLNQRS